MRTRKKLPEILELPTMSSDYQPLQIDDRPSTHNLPRTNMSPEEIFGLFLPDSLLEEMARNTNLNANLHQVDFEEWENDGLTAKHPGPRYWKSTTGPELGVFLGIVLYKNFALRL